MQFDVRSNSTARSVSDFIAAHFTHSGHFCTAATFGSLRNCKVPRPSSCRAMRTASSSLAQSAARYRALHRTTGSSLSGCSRYQEPLQELRSIACATKRPISAVRRREGAPCHALVPRHDRKGFARNHREQQKESQLRDIERIRNKKAELRRKAEVRRRQGTGERGQ